MALSYNNVCLSAGGLKFAAHLGALQFLDDVRMDPTAYAASSAGSVVADTRGGRPQASRPPRAEPAQSSQHVQDRQSWLASSDHHSTWGLFETAARDDVRRLMSEKVKVGKGDPTFRQLREVTGKRLSVSAMRVNDCKLVRFGHDEGTLDTKVTEAVNASCSIPFLNPPAQIDGKFYLDGALAEYCPLGVFNEIPDKSSVIGFSINQPTDTECRNIVDFSDYVNALCDGLIKRLNGDIDDWFDGRTINLNTDEVVRLPILAAPSNKEADQLFESGYRSMQQFYEADESYASSISHRNPSGEH